MEAINITKLYREIRSGWPITLYQPNPKQAQFHASQAISRFLLGGNQSGKTHSGTAEGIAFSCGFRPWLPMDHPDFRVRNSRGEPVPVPNTGRVTFADYQHAFRQAILPKFREIAPASWYTLEYNSQQVPTTVNWAWGSKTFFMSRSADDITFESGTGLWVQHDEDCGGEIRAACLRGLMRWAGKEFFTLTPLDAPWLVDELMAKEDERTYAIFSIDTEDNLIENGGVLDRAVYEQFLGVLTPEQRAIRKSGDYRAGRKKCVENWDNRFPWVIQPFRLDPALWYFLVAVDPHEEKPDCVVFFALKRDGSRCVIYDEVMDHSTKGGTGKTAATVRTHARATGGKIDRGIIDPRAGARTPRGAELTVQASFARAGLLLAPAPGISRGKGYTLLSEWFKIMPETGEPWCQVFSTCVDTISELSHLHWGRKKGDPSPTLKTIGPDDHASCCRYMATWGPTVGKLPEETDDESEPEYEDDDNEAEYIRGTRTGY